MTTLATDKTIAELVTEDFRLAGVFRKYGIDFCCGGKRKLEQVVQDKGIDYNAILLDLEKSMNDPKESGKNAADWDAGFLADYIVNVHHDYVKRTSPALDAWSEKVASVHGHHHTFLVELRSLVDAALNEMEGHMFKEENILFPYIKQLSTANAKGEKIQSHFGTVKNPISVMEHEHESLGRLFTRMEEITDKFTPPEDACNTFRVLYKTLKEFEDDLFLHVHLENNILFPKALELETKMK